MEPTIGRKVVDRVNQAKPYLLQYNSVPACGEYLQWVCAEPEMKAERVGLLSKSAGEAGYTYPNQQRCSHDVLAWPNGERVDIIQSAGGHPAPAGPAWTVIQPAFWRPSNVYVDISGWPIYDSGTPHEGTATDCTIAFGWFCLMTALAKWPDEAKKNMDWILGEMNPSVFRVMLAVEGQSHGSPDVWTDAGVFIHDDWENRYKKMLDVVGNLGKQLHCTIYGGRNQTPTEDDRRRFQDRIIAASQGKWEAIRSFECANEFKVNKWTPQEVRNMGTDMRSKLPAGFLLSLSSPDAAHGGMGANPTNEEMQDSFDELYGAADHSGANEITIHTMRDNGKWSDPFAFNAFYKSLPKINNEPPGPGSSAGGMYADEYQVEKDLTNTKNAGWPMYVTHSEWCVWNGHLPEKYHNGWREIRFVWELPHMPEIAKVVKTEGGPSVPVVTERHQLFSEDTLQPGEQLIATGKTCQAKYDEADGNFVLYTDTGEAVWASQTGGTKPGNVKMNPDGNLVIYDGDGNPVWASHTDGHPGAMCQLNDDRVLVIYEDPNGPKAGTAVWNSAGGVVA